MNVGAGAVGAANAVDDTVASVDSTDVTTVVVESADLGAGAEVHDVSMKNAAASV